MPYQPLEGWIQVTRDLDSGKVRAQRLHTDPTCAKNAVAREHDRARQRGVHIESYLSDKMTYAEARLLSRHKVCKCVSRTHGIHPFSDRRPSREVVQPPPGSGRRG